MSVLLSSADMSDEPRIPHMLEQARAYADEGRLLHACQFYHRLIALAPSSPLGWIQLYQVYCELKQYGPAERVLLKALEMTREPQEIHFLLANLLLRLGKYSQALFHYKTVLLNERSLSKSRRIQLNFNLGLAYFCRGHHRLAESYFRRTRRLDPDFPRINETLGELLLRRNAISESMHMLRRALAIDPYSPIGHYLLGIAYSKLRDWRNAHNEFVAAIEMDPNEPSAWQMCGDVLLALHQLDEAEQYLRKALELDPQLTDAVANFGFLYLKRGDPDRALEYFERALQLEPRNEKALRGKRELIFGHRSHS